MVLFCSCPVYASSFSSIFYPNDQERAVLKLVMEEKNIPYSFSYTNPIQGSSTDVFVLYPDIVMGVQWPKSYDLNVSDPLNEIPDSQEGEHTFLYAYWPQGQIYVVPRGVGADIDKYDYFVGITQILSTNRSNLDGDGDFRAYQFIVSTGTVKITDGVATRLTNEQWGMPFQWVDMNSPWGMDADYFSCYGNSFSKAIYNVQTNQIYGASNVDSVTGFVESVRTAWNVWNNTYYFESSHKARGGLVGDSYLPYRTPSLSYYEPIYNYVSYDYDGGGMPDYLEFRERRDRTDPSDDWKDISGTDGTVEVGDETKDDYKNYWDDKTNDYQSYVNDKIDSALGTGSLSSLSTDDNTEEESSELGVRAQETDLNSYILLGLDFFHSFCQNILLGLDFFHSFCQNAIGDNLPPTFSEPSYGFISTFT